MSFFRHQFPTMEISSFLYKFGNTQMQIHMQRIALQSG